MEKTIDLAIANEKDTLLFCGHGTPNSLLAPKTYGTYMIHQYNAGLIQAKNIIGVMCCSAEFAESVGLHGLFTSMFISNIDGAVNYSITTTQNETNFGNRMILHTLNNIFKMDNLQKNVTVH